MTKPDRKELKSQVEASLYVGPGYVSPARFASYAYQLREILGLHPRSVLEIGIGNGLVSFMLRKAGVPVTTLDFDETLHPDVLASVTHIPISADSYEVVACFEVLEHLPFENLDQALAEIWRVSKRYAVLSLPDNRPCCRVRLPKIGPGQFLFDLPLWHPREHEFDGEHYWELNTKGRRLERIVGCIESAGFSITRRYRPWENPYHHFFVLEKARTDGRENGQ